MGRGEVGSLPGEGKSAAGLGRIQANDEIDPETRPLPWLS